MEQCSGHEMFRFNDDRVPNGPIQAFQLGPAVTGDVVAHGFAWSVCSPGLLLAYVLTAEGDLLWLRGLIGSSTNTMNGS